MHSREFRQMKFQAGLKGIDLEGSSSSSKFDEVAQRANRKIADQKSEKAGTEEEVLDFASLGIAVESE